eukprot:4163565-Pyramimonas_sp.AAC.1
MPPPPPRRQFAKLPGPSMHIGTSARLWHFFTICGVRKYLVGELMNFPVEERLNKGLTAN